MNTWLFAALATEDALFVGLIAALVVAGIVIVVWSRKRGARPAPEAEVDESTEEPVEVVEEPRAKEPAPLLPVGRTIAQGLEKTRKEGFVSRLAGLFRKELEADIEQQIEEVLLTSDIGVKTAQKLLGGIREGLSRAELKDADQVWALLRDQVKRIMGETPVAFHGTPDHKPHIIAVIGVNGSGKTTTIGKLAAKEAQQGRKVMLVAADTFRAAAVDQLAIWAERAGVGFHRGKEEADPASVAFDGIRKGLAEEADTIIIDTAGRLHTQKNLLEELKKILRVAGKAHEGAPHETLLVLDATTGQNAIQQANIFRGEVGVDGIVLTKLDGTAKGGVVIGICDQMKIPVKFVGVGEQVEDLRPFSADAFLDGLFGHRDEAA